MGASAIQQTEEFYDVENGPKQYENLADDPDSAEPLARIGTQLAARIREVQTNDVGIDD